MLKQEFFPPSFLSAFLLSDFHTRPVCIYDCFLIGTHSFSHHWASPSVCWIRCATWFQVFFELHSRNSHKCKYESLSEGKWLEADGRKLTHDLNPDVLPARSHYSRPRQGVFSSRPCPDLRRCPAHHRHPLLRRHRRNQQSADRIPASYRSGKYF